MPKEIKRWRKPGVSYYTYMGLYECPNCGKQFECDTKQITDGKKYCNNCVNKLHKFDSLTHNMSYTVVYRQWLRLKATDHSDMFTEFEDYHQWLKENGWQEGQKIYLTCRDKGFFPENIAFGNFTDLKSQSAVQAKKQKNNTSGYIGVSWTGHSWTARASYRGDKFAVVGFETAYAAARYRDIELNRRNWPNRRNLHSC